jgi:hypothetical protein
MAAQVPPPAMTAISFMGLGLELGLHTKWRTYKHDQNINRFKADFGIIPESCVLLWDALRNSMDPTVRLPGNAKPMHFLLAVRFLWKYHEECDLARYFGMRSKTTARKWWKIYVIKIEKLLDRKVRKHFMTVSLLFMTVSLLFSQLLLFPSF